MFIFDLDSALTSILNSTLKREFIYNKLLLLLLLNQVVHKLRYFYISVVNECLSNPCQNGGMCRNDFKRYICECRPGYVGYNCQDRTYFISIDWSLT